MKYRVTSCAESNASDESRRGDLTARGDALRIGWRRISWRPYHQDDFAWTCLDRSDTRFRWSLPRSCWPTSTVQRRARNSRLLGLYSTSLMILLTRVLPRPRSRTPWSARAFWSADRMQYPISALPGTVRARSTESVVFRPSTRLSRCPAFVLHRPLQVGNRMQATMPSTPRHLSTRISSCIWLRFGSEPTPIPSGNGINCRKAPPRHYHRDTSPGGIANSPIRCVRVPIRFPWASTRWSSVR